ncbi:MAG: RNA polymerase factor sigma-54 [Candidatus Delongbacteria bacterium]|nr:RNA polymerase factor sigma-54 [Candidatus Delongbacteria bacterium]
MQLRQSIVIRQELTQTPQQILRSELLQIPMMLLEARVKMELEENPVLEIEEGELDLEDMLEDKDDDEKADDQVDDDNEVDWDQLGDSDNYEMPHTGSQRDSTAEYAEIPRPVIQTLQEHLITQLETDNTLSYREQVAGIEIIGNLDESGYLKCELGLLAAQLNISETELEKVLKRIQQYDPIGIASRSLQECLLVQALNNDELHPLVVPVLRDHFNDFINKHFELLVRSLQTDLDAVRTVFHEISQLNPRPGEGAIANEKQNYVIPDLIVEHVDGEFIVTLNEGDMPSLRISHYYLDLARQRNKMERQVRDFVQRKLESANWFLNAIQQRRETMLRVMRAIVQRQINFFKEGKDALKPMILRDIAEDIEMDISVISRVTNGKYVQTEWGIFELKYFFSEKVTTSSGEDISTKVIKAELKRLIEVEDKLKPLSDQKLVDLLMQKDFKVARRTVQKYREQMHIPIKKLRRQI